MGMALIAYFTALEIDFQAGQFCVFIHQFSQLNEIFVLDQVQQKGLIRSGCAAQMLFPTVPAATGFAERHADHFLPLAERYPEDDPEFHDPIQPGQDRSQVETAASRQAPDGNAFVGSIKHISNKTGVPCLLF